MTPSSPASGPVKVLIVDDEPEIRRVLRALLARGTSMRTDVQDCEDGESAIALLSREKFDIVISDYRMLQRNGIDVLECAADRYPDSGRVLITGYAEIDIAVDAVNRGRVSGFVRKPWDSRQLLALIESLAPGPGHMSGSTPSPSPAALPAPGVATVAPRHAPSGMAVRSPQKELEDVEHQMRQLRVKFGIGSVSAEGYRKMSEELRERRARLEYEIHDAQNR